MSFRDTMTFQSSAVAGAVASPAGPSRLSGSVTAAGDRDFVPDFWRLAFQELPLPVCAFDPGTFEVVFSNREWMSLQSKRAASDRPTSLQGLFGSEWSRFCEELSADVDKGQPFALPRTYRGEGGLILSVRRLAANSAPPEVALLSVASASAIAPAFESVPPQGDGLMDLSSEWLWEQDEEFRFTWFSPNIYRILKIEASQSSVGKTRWEIAPMDVPEDRWREHRQTLLRREPFRDFIMTRKGGDGRLHTLSISGIPVHDGAGAFRGYRGVGRDISRSRSVEDALRESEARIRALVELSADYYWEQDERLRFTQISSGHTGSAVWKRMIGRTLDECSHDALSEPGLAEYAEATRELRSYRGLIVRCGDDHGDMRVLCVSGMPVFDRDGAFRGYRGVARDTTERCAAEEALRESEERFRLLAENMRDVFWIVDASARNFLYVGRSCERVWGVPREKVYEDARVWHGLLHPDDRDLVQTFLQTVQEGEPIDAEFRIVRPDGTTRWLSARSSIMVNGRGERLTCGITEDITERKLRHDRALELAARQRDALVREVHHRIKNNLQGVVGLLRREGVNKPALRELVDCAVTQVQAVATIHGMQGRSSRMHLRLGEMVQEIVNMLQSISYGPLQCSVSIPAGADMIVAEGEAVALALILNELLLNAVKHSCGGNAGTWVLVEALDGHAQITIRNAGTLPASMRFPNEGLGAGLSLVKALLPGTGVEVSFEQLNDEVCTRVGVTEPVLCNRREGNSPDPAAVPAAPRRVPGKNS